MLQPVATVVVLAPDDAHYARLIEARPDVEVQRCGGPTRATTVANALAQLERYARFVRALVVATRSIQSLLGC